MKERARPQDYRGDAVVKIVAGVADKTQILSSLSALKIFRRLINNRY